MSLLGFRAVMKVNDYIVIRAPSSNRPKPKWLPWGSRQRLRKGGGMSSHSMGAGKTGHTRPCAAICSCPCSACCELLHTVKRISYSLSSLGDDTPRSPPPAELMSSVLSLSCRPSVPFLLTALSHHIYIPCSQAQSWPAAHTGHVCPDAQPCSQAPQTSSFELPQCQFNGPRPLLFPVEKV